MNNLSPSAQALVRGAAKAARPSDADRARNFEALRSRLGDAAMLGQAAAPVQAAATTGAWLKLTALAAGVGLALGGAVYGLSSEPGPVEASVTQVPGERPAPPAALDSKPEPVVAPEAAAADVSPPTAAPQQPASLRRPNDRLAEEVALLSRATSALRAGQASVALKVLNEHQGKFPRGVLAEERRAARAQALCVLGRRAEGESELAKLPPGSPQAARVKQLCSGR
jgi:hypothetical protein